MAGVKGRSGKVTTAASKAKRSAAARKRWGEKPAPVSPPNPAPTALPKTKGKVGRLRSIAEHDVHLGLPQSYGDALKRLQLDEQVSINKRREVELAKAKVDLDEHRGRLVPRDDLTRAVAKIRDAWWREAQQVAGMALPRLADLPGEVRARVKIAIDAEVAAAAERVKVSMTT